MEDTAVVRPLEGEAREERELREASGSREAECEVCGHETYGLHCKILCPNCGYRRDCSDP